MTSLKIKYRPSSTTEKQGRIYYRIIHNRIVSQLKTDYKIYNNEWNSLSNCIVVPAEGSSRRQQLLYIKKKIDNELIKLNKIIRQYQMSGREYSAGQIFAEFTSNKNRVMLSAYMEKIINIYRSTGKVRTAEAYSSTLRNFNKFCCGTDIPLGSIDSDTIISFERFFREKGITPNTSSFYMRNLRAVYNRGVKENIIEQKYPFRYVYTGVGQTVKRAISIQSIKKIKNLNLSSSPQLDFARNIFLLSFYTRGMSFIDMAYLKKKDIQNGILSYRRRKTGQLLHIRWEKCMQEIVNRLGTGDSEYLLPIINSQNRCQDTRTQYIYAAHNINRSLKKIGMMASLTAPLTMYVARHTWASVAVSKQIPISVISQGMGHNSEKTTRIYLATLKNDAIDKANKKILKLL